MRENRRASKGWAGLVLVGLFAWAGCDQGGSPDAAPPGSAPVAREPDQRALDKRPARPVKPQHAFHAELPGPELREKAPAKRYARLTARACRAEVSRRKLPVKAARGRATGVTTPLRIGGSLGGVRMDVPRSVYGLADCRLVLMLDELSRELLAPLGVIALRVNNIYRPGSKLPPKTERAAPRQSQHAQGLALDIVAFELSDGRVLDVERDWRGARGTPVCGPESTVTGDDASGVALRNVVCAIARAGYCNHLLTPNHDEAHDNHIHCDIKAESDEVEVK